MKKNFFFLILKILLFQIKIKFKLPKKIDIFVFDREDLLSIDPILKIFKNKILIDGRFSSTKKIYLNLAIIKEINKNYQGDLSTAYYSSLINLIKPKLILTFVDNSWMFSKLTKKFYKKFHFLAIQNAVRYEIKINNNLYKKKIEKTNLNKNFFYDNFLTFGKYEIDHYRNNNIFIRDAQDIGSLRLANAINNLKTRKRKIKKNKYDICIISDAFIVGTDNRFGLSGLEKGQIKYIKSIIKIIKKHNLNFIFCFKRFQNNINKEMLFYETYLTKKELEFIKNNSTDRLDDKYNSSYQRMLESKLTVSRWSSMLRENIALGRKSLSINYSGKEVSNFPIKGICAIKNPDYNTLENRVLKLINMSEKKYIKLLNKKDKYLINNDISMTKKKIINKIRELIK
tara:strand:- start:22540 stop:23736 length:1197 start_codon:yes stop_codon:yes gene_type:complete